MVLSPEEDEGAHPYWYARVLRIFRLQVISTHPCASTIHSGPREMEVLWVRWLGIEPGHRSGPRHARLPKVGFVDETDPFAFGFLDPDHVIRGCHLMPSFSDGRTTDLLRTTDPTVARKAGEVDDWQCFYVGIFVDRDMFMRYFPGGGVGHTTNDKLFGNKEDDFEHGSDESGDEVDELEESDSDSPLRSQRQVHSPSLTGSSNSDTDEGESSSQSDVSEPCQKSSSEGEDCEGSDPDDWRWVDGYGSA
ncbi:hypothetical protein EV361DRAFT_943355 [Lentinula raphanica]|nr:hypothetical protein EV361DRAFT_943355 [Lentinula raphanica]